MQRDSLQQETYLDVEGEDGATCAARELLEETGYRALNIERLATIYTTPGFTDERIELFRADAEPTDDGGEEAVEVVTLPLGRVFEAIEKGDILDAKTVIGLLFIAGRGA